MDDQAALQRVKQLRHWTGSVQGPRHTCRCEDCQALTRVVVLAQERLTQLEKYRKLVRLTAQD